MNKTLRVLLSTVVLLAGVAAAHAQAVKPVLVVSLTAFDELTADINFVGQLAGQPNAAGMLEGTIMMMTQGQGLKGFDRTKPLGLVVTTTGEDFRPMLFVPVTDLKQLVSVIEGTLGPASDEGAALKFNAPNGQTIYLREKAGWAFFSPTTDGELPADPVQLLAGLNNEYDIAARAYMQNVPQQAKQQGLAQLKAIIQLSAAQQAAGQDEAIFDLQRQNMEQQIAALERMIDQADEVTFGWRIDSQAKNTHVDVLFTAKPGTELATQMQQFNDAKTDFAAFVLPQAAVAWSAATRASQADIEQALASLQQMRQGIDAGIDNDADLPDDKSRAQVKGVVAKLMDIVEQTIKTGKTDIAGSFVLAPGAVQAAAGGFVADGPAAERAIKELVDLAKESELDDQIKVELDFDTYEGMKFHRATVALDDEDAQRVFGEKLDLYVGTGPQSVYFSAGQGSYDLLKSVIAKSKTEAGKTVLPMQVTIALAPIFEFASQFNDNQGDSPDWGALLAEELAKVKGKDRVLITLQGIPNGGRYRIAVEDGILQAIGEAAKNAARQNPAVGGGAGAIPGPAGRAF